MKRPYSYNPFRLSERLSKFTVYSHIPQQSVADLPPAPSSNFDNYIFPDRFSTPVENECFYYLLCHGLPEADGQYAHPILKMQLFRGDTDPGVILMVCRYFDPRPEITTPDKYVPIKAYIEAVRRLLTPESKHNSVGSIYWDKSQPTRATVLYAISPLIEWFNPVVHVLNLMLDIVLDVEDEYGQLLKEHVSTDQEAIRQLVHEIRNLPIGFAEALQSEYKIKLKDKIGYGGTSVVFTGELDLRPIVVKILLPDVRFIDVERLKSRFNREIKITKTLSASGVTPIYHSSGSALGAKFMVQERVCGASLFKMLKEEAMQWSVSRKSEVICALVDAVGRIHKHKIIHRDISPKNIIIKNDGSLSIIDFGAAAYIGSKTENVICSFKTSHLTLPHDRLGSLKYAAPEARDRPSDATEKSDIFSIAIIGYELFLGCNIAGNLPKLDHLLRVDSKLSEFLYNAASWDPNSRPALATLKN